MSRALTTAESAALLADELSQPLTAILATAQALLRTYGKGPPADPEVRAAIEDVTHQAARAAKIVQRMRTIVRRREARKLRLDLNATVRSIDGLLYAGARQHGVSLSFDLARNLPECLGDGVQIQQVVLSLVRNAFDAMSHVPPPERFLRVRTGAAGDSVMAAIEDSGPPLDDAALARLFVPFQTSKAVGLGIDLSLCRSIVEAHGGRIEAVRNGGPGLVVRFFIPAWSDRDPSD